MGRRLFLSHLATAGPALLSHNIHDLLSLDDGMITFTYISPRVSNQRINIQAFATDLGEYPDGNSFMLCAEDDCDEPIPSTLQRLSESTHGKPLLEMLTAASAALCEVTGKAAAAHEIYNTATDDEVDFDFEFAGDSDDEAFGLASRRQPDTGLRKNSNDTALDSSSVCDEEKMERIRADMRELKHAGYRVGAFGNLTTSGMLSVSIRVAKLGLSDEALEAWGISRKHYLVLLIRYPRGYRDATRVSDDKDISSSMLMRVGLCAQYKPSLQSALDVFQGSDSDTSKPKAHAQEKTEDPCSFEPLFIGKSLNQFLEERVFKIIYARSLYRLTRVGGETFISERQASTTADVLPDLEQYRTSDNFATITGLLEADHMGETGQLSLHLASLPLIVMQFVVRHVGRCTEFCMVCHCRVDESFEALKPYVCLKPLCLYQYMALGFGPSLEWEIVTQPYVIDLLISFCYTAAKHQKLKDLPIGMNLTVPVISQTQGPTDPYMARYPQYSASSNETTTECPKSFSCLWDNGSRYLDVQLEENEKEINSLTKQLRKGDWLAVICDTNRTAIHCRVKNVTLLRVELHEPIEVSFRDFSSDINKQKSARESTPALAADCYLYDKKIDDLSKEQQYQAITVLLDTLPGVVEMRDTLTRQGRASENSLKTWKNRISDSALNLLRWIVASNRSCIVQVDDIGNEAEGSLISGKTEDRVGGMDDWTQFRFAQGAPDKEKRFTDCVKQHTDPTNKDYPTLFAWHGSRIGNWHSIIRQGLRYDEVINGRAYGNGVYMSNHLSTSMGYSFMRGSAVSSGGWKPSALNMSNAISLQEVVNKPASFTSSKPHYVVNEIDWIQTRYLFIKTKEGTNTSQAPLAEYVQDPKRLVYNETSQTITIPITAISKCRRPAVSISQNTSPTKKRNKSVQDTDLATAEQREDDADSEISDEGDLALLREPGSKHDLAVRDSQEVLGLGRNAEKKRHAEDPEETDFVLGTLDVDGITFMEEPKDATTIATKALMRLLKDALKTQENTPPRNLGWFVDRNHISNMYQWIVELHSFPKDIPLTKDLKAADLTSVVLEVRFTSEFPFSPPFIRVVKPRFLPFNQGGGGNVTEGGAMCMEVLTNNGWSAGLSFESLLLQVRLVICDTERPARLASTSRKMGFGGGAGNTYGIGEAKAAYIRACQAHGWTVPASFSSIQ